MQIERELAFIVAPIARKKVRVFWKSQKNLLKFREGLLTGAIKDELSGAMTIFGEPDESVRFRIFKARFRERMLNSLFFLEPSVQRSGPYAVDMFKLQRYLFLVQTLAMF